MNDLMSLKTKLVSKEDHLRQITTRLSTPSISDETYRALLKTKNELVADV